MMHWYDFLMEPDTTTPRLSIGRLLLLLTVFTMIVFWIVGFINDKPLPDSLFAAFSVFAGYVFGSKVVGAVRGKSEQAE